MFKTLTVRSFEIPICFTYLRFVKLKSSIALFIIFFILAPACAHAGDEKGKKTVTCDGKKKDCSKPPCSKPPCPTKLQKPIKKEPFNKGRYIPVAPRAGNINAIPDLLPGFELNSPLPLFVKNGSKYGDLTSYYAYADR